MKLALIAFNVVFLALVGLIASVEIQTIGQINATLAAMGH